MYRHKIVDFSSHLALPQIALETTAVDFHGSIFARDVSAERKGDPAHHCSRHKTIKLSLEIVPTTLAQVWVCFCLTEIRYDMIRYEKLF